MRSQSTTPARDTGDGQSLKGPVSTEALSDRALDFKVVHISNYDNLGGASRSAYRLHRALVEAGVQSKMLVGTATTTDSTVRQMRRGPRLVRSADWRAHPVLRRLGLPDLLYPSAPWLYRNDDIRDADIVHLHKIHGGHFSLGLLPPLSRRSRLVWTLHDMWALTGYCYSAFDCTRWQTGCGSCPQLREPARFPFRLEPPLGVDSTGVLWRAKDAIYRRTDLTIVAPSRWLLGLVQESPLLSRFDAHHIPYGVDADRFRPVDKHQARRALGLPVTDRVVLFAAGKGDQQFTRALAMLAASDTAGGTVVALGGQRPGLPKDGPWRLVHRDSVRDERVLAGYYGAADVFVHPAAVDNLPNTILESLSSGTPVVAYDAGGVAEMVRHRETGYLARPQDPRDLADGLAWLLAHDDARVAMGAAGRAMCLREFAKDGQANAYAALYSFVRARSSGDS